MSHSEKVSGAAIEAASTQILDAVNEGSITWKALAEILAKGKKPDAVERPTKIALPAAINDWQAKSLEKLPKVFGSIVPSEVRVLEDTEIERLYEERQTIDDVLTFLNKRRDGLRTTIINHFDAQKEAKGETSRPLDKDGHYLAVDKDQVPIPGTSKAFTWRTSQGAPDIGSQSLLRLLRDPSSPFSEDDWLAMTVEDRRFDEHKAMEHIKANPKLLDELGKVAKPKNLIGTFTVSEAK